MLFPSVNVCGAQACSDYDQMPFAFCTIPRPVPPDPSIPLFFLLVDHTSIVHPPATACLPYLSREGNA